MSTQSIPEITVEELAILLANDNSQLQLIDVREPQEVEIASVEGFEVFPLSQFQQWASSIPSHFNPHGETLVICHHGMRSAQMCYWLQSIGFTNVKNIRGGIHAYSVEIDPSIPIY